MSKELKKVIECYSCGLFLKKTKTKRVTLRCPRCKTKLLIEKNHTFDSLYLSISALLLFILLNIYPLITLTLNGNELTATLIGIIWILFEQGYFVVAVLVLFTIVIAPLLNIISILFSFMQMHTKIKIFTNTLLHDSVHFFKHWAFIDVFIIGVIVTYIKLVGMVTNTKFDLGFYILLVYLLFFYLSNVRFEGKNVFGE